MIKTNRYKVVFVEKCLQEAPRNQSKKHIFEHLSSLYDIQLQEINNCGHWMTGDGKMGNFNSAAAFLAHKEAGSVVKDKISELLPLS